MDRKPNVIVQGRSDMGLQWGNGNGNKEKGIHLKPFQRQNQYDLESN